LELEVRISSPNVRYREQHFANCRLTKVCGKGKLGYVTHCVTGLSSDPPRHREYPGEGGGETTWKIRQIEVTENSPFYWSRKT